MTIDLIIIVIEVDHINVCLGARPHVSAYISSRIRTRTYNGLISDLSNWRVRILIYAVVIFHLDQSGCAHQIVSACL